DEQIERMDEIVRYQLRKPASVDRNALVIATVDVVAETRRLVDGLSKVYASKPVSIETQLDGEASLKGDSGDYLELAGNLLDNACKWCEQQVRVTLSADDGGIELSVDDDGPGIPADAREGLLKRGARLDEAAPGHGIGLAIVKDIVSSYNGSLEIGDSELGGARISIKLPG
ncbi:MAG: ATP-binding protein, partial [Pseudomonadota bacterium]